MAAHKHKDVPRAGKALEAAVRAMQHLECLPGSIKQLKLELCCAFADESFQELSIKLDRSIAVIRLKHLGCDARLEVFRQQYALSHRASMHTCRRRVLAAAPVTEMLDAPDSLALVAFTNDATVLLPPTQMPPAGNGRDLCLFHIDTPSFFHKKAWCPLAPKRCI